MEPETRKEWGTGFWVGFAVIGILSVGAGGWLLRKQQAPPQHSHEASAGGSASIAGERVKTPRNDRPTRLKRGDVPPPPPGHNGDVNEIWVEDSYENNLVGELLIPFDPAELKRLAEDPGENARPMAELVLRAAAEGDRSFRYLLDESMPEDEPGLTLALDAYDYAVNGNQEALDRILAVHVEDFKQGRAGDSNAVWVLAYVNEWDQVKEAFNANPLSGDGSGGDAHYAFWLKRRFLYPDNPRFPKDLADFRKEIYRR